MAVNMLGTRWNHEELNKFYESYRKYGKDWARVAASVPRRTPEMVEALYAMNRAYLSLPEGAASVVGLQALMTDHYSNQEERKSEDEVGQSVMMMAAAEGGDEDSSQVVGASQQQQQQQQQQQLHPRLRLREAGNSAVGGGGPAALVGERSLHQMSPGIDGPSPAKRPRSAAGARTWSVGRRTPRSNGGGGALASASVSEDREGERLGESDWEGANKRPAGNGPATAAAAAAALAGGLSASPEPEPEPELEAGLAKRVTRGAFQPVTSPAKKYSPAPGRGARAASSTEKRGAKSRTPVKGTRRVGGSAQKSRLVEATGAGAGEHDDNDDDGDGNHEYSERQQRATADAAARRSGQSEVGDPRAGNGAASGGKAGVAGGRAGTAGGEDEVMADAHAQARDHEHEYKHDSDYEDASRGRRGGPAAGGRGRGRKRGGGGRGGRGGSNRGKGRGRSTPSKAPLGGVAKSRLYAEELIVAWGEGEEEGDGKEEEEEEERPIAGRALLSRAGRKRDRHMFSQGGAGTGAGGGGGSALDALATLADLSLSGYFPPTPKTGSPATATPSPADAKKTDKGVSPAEEGHDDGGSGPALAGRGGSRVAAAMAAAVSDGKGSSPLAVKLQLQAARRQAAVSSLHALTGGEGRDESTGGGGGGGGRGKGEVAAATAAAAGDKKGTPSSKKRGTAGGAGAGVGAGAAAAAEQGDQRAAIRVERKVRSTKNEAQARAGNAASRRAGGGGAGGEGGGGELEQEEEELEAEDDEERTIDEAEGEAARGEKEEEEEEESKASVSPPEGRKRKRKPTARKNPPVMPDADVMVSPTKARAKYRRTAADGGAPPSAAAAKRERASLKAARALLASNGGGGKDAAADDPLLQGPPGSRGAAATDAAGGPPGREYKLPAKLRNKRAGGAGAAAASAKGGAGLDDPLLKVAGAAALDPGLAPGGAAGGAPEKAQQGPAECKHAASPIAALTSVSARLAHCLSYKGQAWACCEWFYSAIDLPWFALNEFAEYLDHTGLGHVEKLARVEWSVVRNSLGKPRRLSANFLREEREKLALYREAARQQYQELRTGARTSLSPDLARPLTVGQRVLAKHPKTGHIADGSVLTVDRGRCRVQFDRPQLGVELVQDVDMMPVHPYENHPQVMRSRHSHYLHHAHQQLQQQHQVQYSSDNIRPSYRPTSAAGGAARAALNERLDRAASASCFTSSAPGGGPSPFSPPQSLLRWSKVLSARADTAEEVAGAKAAVSEAVAAAAAAATHHTSLATPEPRAQYQQQLRGDQDACALLELTQVLDKKEALLLEFRRMNDDVDGAAAGGAEGLRASEAFRRQYATVVVQLRDVNQRVEAALMRLRTRNRYLDTVTPAPSPSPSPFHPQHLHPQHQHHQHHQHHQQQHHHQHHHQQQHQQYQQHHGAVAAAGGLKGGFVAALEGEQGCPLPIGEMAAAARQQARSMVATAVQAIASKREDESVLLRLDQVLGPVHAPANTDTHSPPGGAHASGARVSTSQAPPPGELHGAAAGAPGGGEPQQHESGSPEMRRSRHGSTHDATGSPPGGRLGGASATAAPSRGPGRPPAVPADPLTGVVGGESSLTLMGPSGHAHKKEASMLSELMASSVATLLMVQRCTERKLPQADVVLMLDSALAALRPHAHQNLPLYKDIEHSIATIKSQIAAQLPVPFAA